MKSRIPLIITAALFTAGCEKKDEPKAAPVVTAPPQPQPARRTPVTPQVATDSPVPAAQASQGPAAQPSQAPAEQPTEEEVQTFLADLSKLAEQVAQLPKDAKLTPEVEALQETYTAIILRRGALMARSNEEQKKKLLLEMGPSAKVIGPVLVRLRLLKARERAKLPGAQPGPALDKLIPELGPPPAKPPAPPQ